jgi:hypothetical protein
LDPLASKPAARSQSNLRSGTPTHCHRCVEADPVVRACVIPSLSRNCIAISAQARIGSSSAHFTSIALSPCSTRKWAALVWGGPSLRGLPAGGCGACPVVAIVPPGCGGGEGMVPGADGREPLDGGCGGCAKTTVANSAAATPKHRVDGFNTILSRQMAVAYPSLSTATSGSRSGERTGHRRRLLAWRAVGVLLAHEGPR